MSDAAVAGTSPHRPEYVRQTEATQDFGVVEKPLTLFERIYNQGWVRKAVILLLLAVIWQSYASCMNAIQFKPWLGPIPPLPLAGWPGVVVWPLELLTDVARGAWWIADVIIAIPFMIKDAAVVVFSGSCKGNELLVPKFTVTMTAFWEAMKPAPGALAKAWSAFSMASPLAGAEALIGALFSGDLMPKALNSVRLLLKGYAWGLGLAMLLTALAIFTQFFNDFLETLTSMFNPLPAIALLPLALIWFGLGDKSIIFVLVHSVLWAVALNTHSGFKSVSNTLRMVGRNYGLGGFRYIFKILIPAAFPSILTGLKIGWAFAWRTLIAAELVFGASSGKGGLGWFIYESKNQLDIPAVFAGLFTVITIGLLVENLIFKNIEARTVRKWGMQT